MKLVRINYLIDHSHGKSDESRHVTGYAIDYPKVRLCVRERAMHDWCIDHYDTGLGIDIPGHWPIRSKKNAAKMAVRYVDEKVANGEYQKSLDRAYCSSTRKDVAK